MATATARLKNVDRSVLILVHSDRTTLVSVAVQGGASTGNLAGLSGSDVDVMAFTGPPRRRRR